MNRVKEIRELTGLSQVKFASKYGIQKGRKLLLDLLRNN